MAASDPTPEQRIATLEERLAYLEFSQEEQARVQAELQQENQALTRQLEWLHGRLRALEAAAGDSSAGGQDTPEPPPPHY
ncbi:SlyX family protein [Thioalkalivibrio sp. ALE19]|uniref:SlyX family protein n=1 Tax=Thioalkalivibrio sp. ALE19 TaxID=1266909 RepID=UPI000405026B|nr:SlyX family protein [Thioalkalivibrio sp. ALE19]